ncbi:hypothetical protein LCGC14_0068310 [marine sediment metagenome]|uniref:Sulfatase N-terminal domain-containing protein n=2 Tax=root TaxID=1 RepID=A0A0F9VMS2_9ZZZZ
MHKNSTTMKKNYASYCLISIIALTIFSCNTHKPEVKKPNILFISIDDLRPTLGVYGDSIAVTPNIDYFASEGMTFRQTFTQSAVCAPSRASLMTGLRPDSTRVWHLGDKFRELKPDVVTMPQHFSKFGYHTVNVGKMFHNYMPDSISWDEPDLRPEQFKRPTWLNRDGETFYISKDVQKSQATKRDSLLKLRPMRYADGWNTGPAWESADVHDSLYYDGAQTEIAKRALTRLAKNDKPFYMGLGYFRPHLPFAAPKKYWDYYNPEEIPLAANPNVPKNAPGYTMNSMYELRSYDGFNKIGHPQSDFKIKEETSRKLKHGYYASVSYIDGLLGDLFAHMKEIGIYENTIIIIWGDHGWKLGEHNSWGKMTNYNIDLKVPMIIRYPNQENRGMQTFAFTELVDMFPSLCELAGIETPKYMQGTSFVPLIKEPNRQWKNAAFSQFHRRPKVSADGNRYMGYSINTKKHHYIEWYSWNPETGTRGDQKDVELYDIESDPNEFVNIASNSNQKKIVETLSKQLEGGWRKALPN